MTYILWYFYPDDLCISGFQIFSTNSLQKIVNKNHDNSANRITGVGVILKLVLKPFYKHTIICNTWVQVGFTKTKNIKIFIQQGTNLVSNTSNIKKQNIPGGPGFVRHRRRAISCTKKLNSRYQDARVLHCCFKTFDMNIKNLLC